MRKSSARLAAAIALVGLATIAWSSRAVSANGHDQVRVVIANPALDAKLQMPKGTGHIAGQVVEDGSTRAVPGVVVTLSMAGRFGPHVLSDGDGRFVFDQLPPGRFTLTATLAGYAPGAYGRLRPEGTSLPIDLAEGQRLTTATIALWRLGALGGTVVDDAGEPVVGAMVQAYRRTIAGGRWRFATSASDTTDDRGQFRLGSLVPGSYVVAVPMTSFSWPSSLEQHMLHGAEWPEELAELPETTRSLIGSGLQVSAKAPVVFRPANRTMPVSISLDGQVVSHATQFFSGAATAAQATSVAVGAGDERLGVDFVLRPTSTTTVSGEVSGPSGAIGDLIVRLGADAKSEASMPFESALSITDGRGRFTFAGVPPGQYSIRVLKIPARGAAPVPMKLDGTLAPTTDIVQPELPREPVLWAESSLAVGETPVSNVSLALRPGITARGRLEIAGSGARPTAAALSRIALALDRADGHADLPPASGRGRIEADGAFGTTGVPPGRYLLRVTNVPSGWVLQSALVNGRDITALPIDLTTDVVGARLILTDAPTGITGRIAASDGAPDSSVLVVAFPADPTTWLDAGSAPRRLRSARADGSGAFSIRDLPVGQYFVVAISESTASDWEDPARLTSLARVAVRVDVVGGELRPVTLPTVSREPRQR